MINIELDSLGKEATMKLYLKSKRLTLELEKVLIDNGVLSPPNFVPENRDKQDKKEGETEQPQ